MKRAAALAHIHHLARLGAPSRATVPEMLGTLDLVVPGLFSSFIWLGAGREPRDGYIPGLIPAAMEVMVAPTSDGDFRNPGGFTQMVRGQKSWGNSDAVTEAEGFRRSRLYHEGFCPYGIDHSTDVQIHDRGRMVGLLCANRDAGTRRHSSQEIAVLLSVAPAFAHALAADASEAPQEFDGVCDRAVLTLDADGTIIEASEGHAQLLADLVGLPLTNSFTQKAFADAVAAFLRTVVASWPKIAVHDRVTASGRIVLRLFAAGTDGHLFCLVELHKPLRVAVAGRLRKLPLAPREREVAMELALNPSKSVIAHRLGITGHTLHDYRRRIYRRLDIRSRDELRRTLGL